MTGITFHSLGSNVSKYLSSSLSELDELLSLFVSLFFSDVSSFPCSEFDSETFLLLRDMYASNHRPTGSTSCKAGAINTNISFGGRHQNDGRWGSRVVNYEGSSLTHWE